MNKLAPNPATLRSSHRSASVLAAALAILLSGCHPNFGDPSKATRPYPADLTKGTSVEIQVIPRETSLTVVNATPISYSGFDLWLNRRYVTRIASLPAGETIEVQLESFRDEWGGAPYVGGFWRTYDPTPVVLLQIQTAPDQPLVGLLCALPESSRE